MLTSVSIPAVPSPVRSSARAALWSLLTRPRLLVFLVVILIAAMLIRLAAVVALRDVNAGPSIQFGADPFEFDALAWNVARGAGYVSDTGQPTSFRAPGFPLALSGLYVIAGRNYPLVYAALCALGAASCVLTYFVARELLPEPAARLAAVLAAGYVPHVYFATLLLSENLFVPCLALVAWLVLRHLRTGSHASSSAAGLCLGAAILTRPFALLLVPLVFMILVARMWNHRTLRGWSAAAALLLCTAIVVVPWTLRNQRVHHRFVLVATNGGSTFYGGNNDKVAALSPAVGTWVSTRSLPGRDQVDAAPDEVTHDQLEWRLGVDWVREHLSRLPLLLTAKPVRLCLPDVDSANRKYVLLNVLGFTPFLLLMLLGLTRCARDGSLQTVPWMLIHGILLWGSPRFRDANMPILMLYAALGVRKSPEACDG